MYDHRMSPSGSSFRLRGGSSPTSGFSTPDSASAEDYDLSSLGMPESASSTSQGQREAAPYPGAWLPCGLCKPSTVPLDGYETSPTCLRCIRTSLLRSPLSDKEALTSELGTEADFDIDNNPSAFTSGHMTKPVNPKRLLAVDVSGELVGQDPTLRTFPRYTGFGSRNFSRLFARLFNPKGFAAYCALSGLVGLEKGSRTDRNIGVSADEQNLDESKQIRLPIRNVINDSVQSQQCLGTCLLWTSVCAWRHILLAPLDGLANIKQRQ